MVIREQADKGANSEDSFDGILEPKYIIGMLRHRDLVFVLLIA